MHRFQMVMALEAVLRMVPTVAPATVANGSARGDSRYSGRLDWCSHLRHNRTTIASNGCNAIDCGAYDCSVLQLLQSGPMMQAAVDIH
jgi:hypothetical protein